MVWKVFTNSFTWMDAFLGFVPGSVGETSVIAIGIGLVILLITKVASYRISFGNIVRYVGNVYNPKYSGF